LTTHAEPFFGEVEGREETVTVTGLVGCGIAEVAEEDTVGVVDLVVETDVTEGVLLDEVPGVDDGTVFLFEVGLKGVEGEWTVLLGGERFVLDVDVVGGGIRNGIGVIGVICIINIILRRGRRKEKEVGGVERVVKDVIVLERGEEGVVVGREELRGSEKG
jgi:hypothetical protein